MKESDPLKFTKIVATVSGRNCTPELLAGLVKNGMDVVRCNTAHITPEELENLVKTMRSVDPRIAVMIDTKGPNIRTCGLTEPVSLKKGEETVISGTVGKGGITVNYEPFAAEVPVGSRIVCDDGAAQFSVIGKTADGLLARALFDCTVLDRKSINVPDVSLHAPALTDRDRQFLAQAVTLGADFIAHSFVRNAADVLAVREVLGTAGANIGIIAKIENREGVNNLAEILDAADGVMVARGDLGIEIPLEEVPAIQKTIIHEAMLRAKPVITATQMLQSMENSPTPTRAEVSDVANAVYDGTDAVMLSGETAHGQYPLEAVAMMAKIVRQAELAPLKFFTRLDDLPEDVRRIAYILTAAVKAAEILPVKAIICSTSRGLSARICAAWRQRVPICASTPNPEVARQLMLTYGIIPVVNEYCESPAGQAVAAVCSMAGRIPDLTGESLVMLISKHAEKMQRNNLCCLATLDELRMG